MTDKRLRAAATAVGAFDILALAAAVTMLLLTRDSVPEAWRSPDNWTIAPAALPFAVVGVLIVRRLPRHPVGWLLLAAAASIALVGFGMMYTAAAVFARWPLPYPAWGMWLNQTAWVPAFLLPTVLPVVYPDGKLISRRWLVAVFAVAGVALVSFVIEAFGNNEAIMYGGYHYRNPMPIQIPLNAMPGSPTVGALFAAFLILYPLGLAAFVVRWRGARSEERQQLKIFLYVLGILVVAQSLQLIPTFNGPSKVVDSTVGVVSQLALDALPVAIAIAIFRYRLYDIDVVISRTLVYGALAAFITVIYVVLVVGVGSIAGSRANVLLSVGATAIVAVAFQPLRDRSQRLANRLVYGPRATPYEVLSQFAHQLVGTPSVEDMLPAIAHAAAEATGAPAATARIHLPSGGEAVASWPGPRPGAPSASEWILVDQQPVGALEIHGVSELDAAARPLLVSLAKQAALIYRNIGLTLELEDRLRDIAERATVIRASRLRILTAADGERRRLEAEISRTTSRSLDQVSADLARTATLVGFDASAAASMLEQSGTAATQALDALRELARGVFPPLLVDKGLVAALSAFARRQAIPVDVVADDVLSAKRFEPKLEATAYFCCVAALQHAARLGAERAEVELRDSADAVCFTVTGFGLKQRPQTSEAGEIVDRMDAAGGSLTLEDVDGGAKLVGRIPLPAQAEEEAAVQTLVSVSGPNSDFGTYAAAPHSVARGAYSPAS